MSEAEARRQHGLHKQAARENRARFFGDLRRELACGVRMIFIFLMGSAIAVFVFSHLTEINSITTQKAGQLAAQVKTHLHADQIQQNDLNHEKDVDEITK